MPDITDLPVMTRADAIAAGFAGYNDVPHKPIDVPDGAFTITAKTSEGRRVTFCFLEKTYGGPPRFIDIQFHDRGTTIPNADNGVSPTFNAFAITRGGKFVADSRPLDEDIKPSILVLMLDKAGEEPTRPSRLCCANRVIAEVPLSPDGLIPFLTRTPEAMWKNHPSISASMTPSVMFKRAGGAAVGVGCVMTIPKLCPYRVRRNRRLCQARSRPQGQQAR